MITIDGSFGEGGGQVLRSSLALSAALGQPFRIESIRAGRKKPGLMRQHLTSVEAAAAISGASTSGAEIGSQTLEFRPGALRGGEHTFAVGTAGSTMLVLQAVLAPLLRAAEPSHVTLTGGTHNPFAPPWEFVERTFLPQLAKLGARVEGQLVSHGFYPAGGGEVHVTIEPLRGARALTLLERGERLSHGGAAVVSNLALRIAEEERLAAAKRLTWQPSHIRVEEVPSPGPGNVIGLELEFEHVTEIATGFGEKRVGASRVATSAADRLRRYLKCEAPVGAHLADQLMIPLALFAGGRYRTVEPSRHTKTNAELISRFVREATGIEEAVRLEKQDREDWMVTVRGTHQSGGEA